MGFVPGVDKLAQALIFVAVMAGSYGCRLHLP